MNKSMRARIFLSLLLVVACDEPTEHRAEITDFTVLSGLVATEPLLFRVHWAFSNCEQVVRFGAAVEAQTIEIEVIADRATGERLAWCTNARVAEDTTMVFALGVTGPVVLRGLQPHGVAPLERSLVIAP